MPEVTNKLYNIGIVDNLNKCINISLDEYRIFHLFLNLGKFINICTRY